MTPEIMKGLYQNFLCRRPELIAQVDMFRSKTGSRVSDLEGNLLYQIALARVHYLQVNKPIPIQ